jgi:hypothetical protein
MPNESERIRRRAYERWEREGRPQGRDTDHWLEAERELASDEPPKLASEGISHRPVAEEIESQSRVPSRGARKEA